MHPNQQTTQYVPYPAKPPTSALAVASLVLGIFGVLAGWCLVGLPSLAAIVLGHLGLNATKHGRMGGRGMAATGLTLGYIFVAPTAAVAISFVLSDGAPPAKPAPSVSAPVARVISCEIADGGATAEVSVTNTSTKAAGYWVTVHVLTDGGVRVGEGFGSVAKVDAGKSAATTITVQLDASGGKTCKVTEVR